MALNNPTWSQEARGGAREADSGRGSLTLVTI